MKRYCPRCNVGHEAGEFCPQSRQNRQAADARRGNFRQRGYTPTWDKFRVLVLQAEPFCRWCRKRGKLIPATLVDHIVPLAAGGPLLDWDNACPMCTTCHAIKTAEDYRKYPAAYGKR